MPDYCSASKFIANYAASGTGSATAYFKNVDAVTVESDLVACNQLTIDGVSVDGTFSTLNDKTQNQTAVPNTTTFTGTVAATGINTANVNTNTILPFSGSNVYIGSGGTGISYNNSNNRVGIGTASAGYPLDVVGEIQTRSRIRIVDATSTSSITLLRMLGSTVSTSTTTNEIRMTIGTSEGTRTAGVISWYPRSDVNNNKMSLYIYGTTSPQIDLNASATVPYVGMSTRLCTTPITVAASSGTSVLIDNIPEAATVITLSVSELGLNSNSSISLRVGTAAGILAGTQYSFTFDQKNATNAYTTGINGGNNIQITPNLNNNEKVYGNITLTKMKGTGTNISYVVSGVLKLIVSTGGDQTNILTVAGWINTQAEIKQIQFVNPGSASTFNVATALVQVTTL